MAASLQTQHTSWLSRNKQILHAIIMLIIIFGIGHLEPPGSLTPLGMKLSGIFLALLYGWTVSDLFWPSIIGLVAMAFSGMYDTLAQFWQLSFGNETVVFLLFMFGFTEVLTEVGLVNYIANKMISFQFLNNRPWLFSFVFLFATYLIAYINMFAAILVPWSIFYIIADKFDFKPYEKYPTLMIIGIILASVIGGCVMPYKPVPLVIMRAYTQLSGVEADLFKHIIFALVLTIALLIVYVLICRFLFRPDLKELKHINVDFVDQSALILNTKQKIVLGFFLAFIFLMIAPSLLPKTGLLYAVIHQLGIAGCTMVLVVLMTIIPYQGEPLLDFTKMSAQSINWGIFMTMAFVLPFTSIYTADATGVKPFILELIGPVLNGLPPVLFLVVVMLVATILTNFMNNMVVGALLTTVICSLVSSMDMDIAPILGILIICASLAIVTPAACPNAAVMFANKKWCRTSDLYKYCSITVILLFLFTMTVGLLWANIVY